MIRIGAVNASSKPEYSRSLSVDIVIRVDRDGHACRDHWLRVGGQQGIRYFAAVDDGCCRCSNDSAGNNADEENRQAQGVCAGIDVGGFCTASRCDGVT